VLDGAAFDCAARPDPGRCRRSLIISPATASASSTSAGASSAVAGQLVFKRSGQLHVQAGSGDLNSLGSIHINFPNKDGVYMHDTPSKNLFGEVSASIPRAVCGCRTCASWSIGC
jgi:hypothetical protein